MSTALLEFLASATIIVVSGIGMVRMSDAISCVTAAGPLARWCSSCRDRDLTPGFTRGYQRGPHLRFGAPGGRRIPNGLSATPHNGNDRCTDRQTPAAIET
jgi:hypothetical protein